MSKVGRNEPCPCGSGKKHKHCCLAAASSLQRHPLHSLDEALVADVLQFARQRFGQTWFDEAEELYVSDIEPMPEEHPLMMQWWMYHHVLHEGEAPLIDLFLEEKGRRLEAQRLRWIGAQKKAWVSLWEVRTVQPELGTVQLRDLLSGETRSVYELSMSAAATPLTVILGRVVDFDGTSLLCGTHPAMLAPLQAQEVVTVIREFIGITADEIPLSVLREPTNAEQLLELWRSRVDAAMHAPMPQLSNTDGDPMEWTEDTFVFEAATRAEVVECMALVGELRVGDETVVSFVRAATSPWTTISLGRAVIGDDWLRIDSNSAKRADALRKKAEDSCGPLIRFKQREQRRIEDTLASAPVGPPSNNDLLDIPELQDLLKQKKLQHYRGWIDAPVPAIGGLTPREAAVDPQQRAMLEALIKDIEMRESRQDHRQRVDLSFLWEALGLER